MGYRLAGFGSVNIMKENIEAWIEGNGEKYIFFRFQNEIWKVKEAER